MAAEFSKRLWREHQGNIFSEVKVARATPDAIALLKADHRAVEELFEAYEGARGSAAKAKLAQKICLELSVHTTIEEEILYPAVRGEVEDDMLDEAYVEHDGAKALIAELMAGSPDDDFYDAKVKVLSEEIKHHVKEEEQRGGMFSKAQSSDMDLAELGVRLRERKLELMGETSDDMTTRRPPEGRARRGSRELRER